MKNIAIIPHTGDIRLKAEADNFEKLFTAALEGMNKVLNKNYEKELNKHTIMREFSISSPDITALLIDFLSTILTLSYMEKAVFYKIEALELAENRLYTQLLGAKINGFTKDIKAVTYHEAQIIKNDKGNYETMIVFDI